MPNSRISHTYSSAFFIEVLAELDQLLIDRSSWFLFPPLTVAKPSGQAKIMTWVTMTQQCLVEVIA